MEGEIGTPCLKEDTEVVVVLLRVQQVKDNRRYWSTPALLFTTSKQDGIRNNYGAHYPLVLSHC